MKKSEFKEYLKTEILKMQEAEIQVNNPDEAAEVAEKVPDANITVKEFKNYLRNEILREIEEQEEIDTEEEIDFTPEDPGDSSKALELDDIGDTLVALAKRAKDVDEREAATIQ